MALIMLLYYKLLHCRIVALMITDTQKSKVKMKNKESRENGEKKEKKIDISISNHVNGFLNFLGFIAFTILVTFESHIIRP